MTSRRGAASTSKRTRPQWQPPRCVITGGTLPLKSVLALRGAAGAQDGLDFVGRARGGEEIALAHAAARLGEELPLRLGLDALRDDVEVEAARKGDERPGEACALGVDRQAGDELAVDAHSARAQAL